MSVIDLKCRKGANAAVVAACHPAARVFACDDDPGNVEATRELIAAADLDNATVLEVPIDRAGDDPRMPDDADLVVIDDVVSTVDERDRSRIAAFLSHRLRPGGVVAVRYRALSGWCDLLALRRAAQLVGRHAPLSRSEQARSAVELLRSLRHGGARYLADRPNVHGVVDALVEADLDQVADVLLTPHLAPMTMAEVASILAPSGCQYVAGAMGVGLPDSNLPSPLLELLDDVRDDRLRESLRDIGARQWMRTDVFRKGLSPLEPEVREEQLRGLGMVPLIGSDEDDRDAQFRVEGPSSPVAREVLSVLIDRLRHGGATVGELLPRSGPVGEVDAADVVRALLQTGLVHPASPSGSDEASARCRRLNAVLATTRGFQPVLASPVIGSAVASSPHELAAIASGAFHRDFSRQASRRRALLVELGVLADAGAEPA